MGRPVQKRNFGNVTGTDNQLKMIADIGSGPEDCWIQSQRGTRLFEVASVAGGSTPTRTGSIRLVDQSPAAEGEGRLDVIVFNGIVENARTLQQHRVKTFQGNQYSWKLDVAAAVVGEADLGSQ